MNSNTVEIKVHVDTKTGQVSVKQLGSATDKSFKKMQTSAKSVSEKIRSHWLAVSAAFAAVGYAAKKGLESAINSASNLEETSSKFNVVFASQIEQAERWAGTLRESYAMSRRESKQYLSSMQDLLVPMGMAEDLAGKLSFKIVKLAADLGSFNNMPTAQVMGDIQSALVGNYETMKKYGVVLNATIVQEKALAMGLAKTKDGLTAAHKAQAAYKLIMQGSTAAIGDMARTSAGYANQQKKFKALVEDISATIGKSLLPGATKIVAKMSEWIKANEELIGQKTAKYVDTVTSAIKRFADNYENIKGIVVELGKFYLISKAVGGLTAVITFFEGMTIATGALAVKTALLNKAMKANLLILLAYGSYKAGEWLTNWQSGIGEIEKDIEKWTQINARLEAELLKAQAKAPVIIGLQAQSVSQPTVGGEADKAAAAAAEERAAAVKAAAAAEIEAIISVAEEDKKALQSRLSEYEKFYSSLEAKIAQAAASEKQHIEELNALYRQKANLQKSTEEMIRAIKERGMSASEQYASREKALNAEYLAAMRLSGQEKVSALEKYKQSMAGFASTYASGVSETYTRFGADAERVIVSAEKVSQKAAVSIKRAALEQEKALDSLIVAKERQILKDQAWGDALKATARDAVAEIEYLEYTIEGLSATIDAMQKTVEIEGVDLVSPVVDRIKRELASLHDKTITITTRYRTIGSPGGGSYAIGSYAKGVSYVPMTGLYMLHEGEEVRTRAKVASSETSRSLTVGSIQIVVPESAAPQTPADWREIVRNEIIPELRKAGA